MYKPIGLVADAVAAADIARNVWVAEAAREPGATSRTLAIGSFLLPGGLSLALLGIVMRTCLEARHSIADP